MKGRPEEWRTETENERMLEEQQRTELEVFEKVCNFLEKRKGVGVLPSRQACTRNRVIPRVQLLSIILRVFVVDLQNDAARRYNLPVSALPSSKR
ncbi:hypothetical protein K0M31_008790 [Melipona bicolor]|uniref:Uncharacterized protein n=1 Tax=Melipona bicolor TaxID=60889 RepID=A0AA40FQC8_9HYME|nr:hypothetical protein K0M31_008790 [Melipona bicolor]